VTFAQPLPPAVTCSPSSKLQWVNDALTAPGFQLINTTIQSRRFGVLCMGRDGIIAGNRFLDNPGPSILLINDDDYDNPRESRMGYMPRNITIVGNTFINASRCVPDPYHAGTAPSMLSVIGSAVVGPNTSPFGTVPEPFVRVAYHGAQNISIVNNTIDTWFRGAGVLLGEVSGGVVRGNTIARPPDVDAPAVDVSDSDSIRVEDNLLIGGWAAIEGDGEGSAAAVRVAKNTTGVEVAHNTLRQS
jgi:hypothetical protein